MREEAAERKTKEKANFQPPFCRLGLAEQQQLLEFGIVHCELLEAEAGTALAQ